MNATSTYFEEDLYAERVAGILAERGLILQEEEAQFKRFLRGW